MVVGGGGGGAVVVGVGAAVVVGAAVMSAMVLSSHCTLAHEDIVLNDTYRRDNNFCWTRVMARRNKRGCTPRGGASFSNLPTFFPLRSKAAAKIFSGCRAVSLNDTTSPDARTRLPRSRA